MQSFFILGQNRPVEFDAKAHRTLVFKFILVKIPDAEPVLVLGGRNFAQHYQIVDAAIEHGLLPRDLVEEAIRGGTLRKDKVYWHSNVYGGIEVKDRTLVLRELGEPVPVECSWGFFLG